MGRMKWGGVLAKSKMGTTLGYGKPLRRIVTSLIVEVLFFFVSDRRRVSKG